MKLRNEHKVIYLDDAEKIKEYKAMGYVEVPEEKAVVSEPQKPAVKPFKNQTIPEQTETINACKTVEDLKALEADVKATAKGIFEAKLKELEEGNGQDPVPFKELSDEEQVKVIEACEKLEDLEALIALDPKENALKALEAKIDELSK